MKRKFAARHSPPHPLFLIGSAAHAQYSSNAYTAPRNAVVDAAGAKRVEVEAGAGSLRVEGKAGLRQVQVTGTARSSSQQFLSQIKLIAERRGMSFSSRQTCQTTTGARGETMNTRPLSILSFKCRRVSTQTSPMEVATPRC